jgi:DNA-binding transcriptional MocR family regulator
MVPPEEGIVVMNEAPSLAGSLHPKAGLLRRTYAACKQAVSKRKPKDGVTHWSSRKLATELGISFMDVQRIWRRHDLKPHRVDRHMVSNDPDFESKAADVIGLYLNPPARAAVFCVDEKTATQALDRKDRMLPLSPGRAGATALNTSAMARSACFPH